MLHHSVVIKLEELSNKGINNPAILEMASFISTPRKELAEATTKKYDDKLFMTSLGSPFWPKMYFILTYVFSGIQNSRPTSNDNLKSAPCLAKKL